MTAEGIDRHTSGWVGCTPVVADTSLGAVGMAEAHARSAATTRAKESYRDTQGDAGAGHASHTRTTHRTFIAGWVN